MASEVDWNSLGGKDEKKSGGSKGGKSSFLRFESGRSYKLRPVGSPVEYLKFWVKTSKGNRAVNVELDDGVKVSTILSEHTGQEIKPQLKYAINVIDRSDDKIKIMEAGKQVFKSLGTWARANNTHPGGMQGVDWLIEVEGDGFEREYTAMPLQPQPFTKEEIERIKEKGELYNLKDVFKGVEPDAVIDKAFGEGSGPDKEPEPQPVAATKSEEAGDPVLAGSLGDDPVKW